MSLVREGGFFSRKACYLNPTFGSTRSNADLLIDDRLIEIKTVKNLVLDRRHLHQLVQYYILLLSKAWILDASVTSTTLKKCVKSSSYVFTFHDMGTYIS